MRTYTYAPGALPNVMENWAKALPERVKLSPLCLVAYSELGGLNKWLHIWAYPTLDARNNTRDKAKDAGIWPPVGGRREDRRQEHSLRRAGKQDRDAGEVLARAVSDCASRAVCARKNKGAQPPCLLLTTESEPFPDNAETGCR